jgi:signal peptidase I
MNSPDTKPFAGSSLMDEFKDWLKSIAVALIIVFVIHQFVFNLSTVKGHSMEPTLRDGEWLFVNKLVYLIGEPKRGDIVIFKDPSLQGAEAHYLVKRIIGVEGDKLEIHAGKLYVNGLPVEETYTDTEIQGSMAEVTVREGHLFVMGDNRHAGASKDSRTFGEIPVSDMEGRAQFVLWPVTQWGVLAAEGDERG